MWMLLCLGMILVLYILKVRRFDYWKIRGVPTASGCHWFFGHYKPVLFQEKHIKTAVDEMYKEFPRAPAVGYFKLVTPGLLVRDPELAKTILITEFSNFATNGFFIDKKFDFLAGSNPFFVRDAEWKAVRSHATAAVTFAKLKWYLPRILAVGDELAKYITNNCDGGAAELDVKQLATMFTADVLGNAICGVVNNSFVEPDSLFARITREVCFATSVLDNLKDALQTACPALSCIFQMRFSSRTSEEQLLYVTRRVIQERASTGVKRNDLYQVAITMRENDPEEVFTDQYISSLVYTVMLDQSETGSNAIVNTLFALAWHPEIQERLRKEIVDFKSQVKEGYIIEDIENLKYLDMVFSVFTDQYISSLVYTVMLDQSETGSNAIVNTLFALAWHPEIQERLRKEIVDFKSQVKEGYIIEDIENLKYLDMVFSETLRMCSPVPVLSRECTNDCLIHAPGLEKPLEISKGTRVIVPSQSIHMDATYYPNPGKFDPERFTEEEVAKRPKYTYLPFGEGPKRCLAPRLGALQAKVALVSILDRFKIRPAGVRFPLPSAKAVFLISCPVSGAKLRFEPIQTQGQSSLTKR